MKRYLLNRPIYLVLSCIVLSCTNKITYPTYFEGKNTVVQLPHANDSTLTVTNISSDPKYGRSEGKPIFLGVKDVHDSGKNRVKYLNGLAGPKGEELQFKRYKSCCPFKTQNSRTVGADQKFGLLDIWIVSYDGITKPDTLYVNAYDQGELIAPKGYTTK